MFCDGVGKILLDPLQEPFSEIKTLIQNCTAIRIMDSFFICLILLQKGVILR